jgi:TonB family protein
MRCSIILVLVFAFCSLTSSQVLLQKTWVGTRNAYVQIGKDSIFIGADGGIGGLPYRISGDTIRITESWWYGSGAPPRLFVDSYCIRTLTPDSLVLLPLPGNSRNHFDPSSVHRFCDVSLAYDTSIVFDSVYFSGTGCLGVCPAEEIAFDSSGHVRFIGYSNTEPYLGSFAGTLNRSWLNRFADVLRHSRLDSIPSSLGEPIDAPVYLLRLSYNGRQQVIHGSSFSPFNWPLVRVLSGAFREALLTKADTVSFEDIDRRYPHYDFVGSVLVDSMLNSISYYVVLGDTLERIQDFLNRTAHTNRMLPTILTTRVPLYPELARRAGLEADVIVRLNIDSAGTVQSSTILSSSGADLFDRSVLEALTTWRFRPFVDGQSPRSFVAIVPVNFRISETEVWAPPNKRL